jgi:spermidine synthase
VGVLRRTEADGWQTESLAQLARHHLGQPLVVIERVQTPRGELVLRRDGEHLEVISNGTFLMDSRGGESEKHLVAAALQEHPAPRRVLIGGLGVGFSLNQALADERVAQVEVVEIESALVAWHQTHLAAYTAQARADPRTEIVVDDLVAHVRSTTETYDVICLDIDNGPDWTVTSANAALYDDDGTSLIASRLAPDGVLSVWSAARSTTYEEVLARHFQSVTVHEVAVPRGEPDVVVVAKGLGGVRRRHGNRDCS